MKAAKTMALFVLALIASVAALCASPWYELPAVSVFISLIKPLGLLLAAALAGVVFSRLEQTGTARRAWLALATGLGLQFVGQSVLAVHQVFLGEALPFPSMGDPFFVVSAPFMLWALFAFCLRAYRSGLSLGGAWAFWWPALAVAALFLITGWALLASVLRSQGTWAQTFLNVFYPVYSAVALAPCAVMLRVAWKFRGGRLLFVWFPLTVGLSACLASDVLFAYLTSLGQGWTRPLVDLLYVSAYLLVPCGIAFQLALLGRD